VEPFALPFNLRARTPPAGQLIQFSGDQVSWKRLSRVNRCKSAFTPVNRRLQMSLKGFMQAQDAPFCQLFTGWMHHCGVASV